MNRPQFNFLHPDDPSKLQGRINHLYPHEAAVPSVRYGLVRFAEKLWQSLVFPHRSLKSAYAAIQLSLAGRYPTNKPEHSQEHPWTKIRIDTELDRAVVPVVRREDILRTSYISRVTAISKVLEVTTSLDVTSVPDFTQTIADPDLLLKDLRTVPHAIPVCRVHSFRLGSFKVDGPGIGTVYVLIPGWYTATVGNSVHFIRRASIYECLIYPALEAVSKTFVAHLPRTYPSALASTRTVVTLTPDQTASFGHHLQRIASACSDEGLSELVFAVQVHGLERQYRWSSDDMYEEGRCFADVRRFLAPSVLKSGEVYCDYGTTISAKGRCLKVLTSSHAKIIRDLIPALSSNAAKRLVKKPDFIKLESASVYQLCGFLYKPIKWSPELQGLVSVHVKYAPRLDSQVNRFPHVCERFDITSTSRDNIQHLCDQLQEQTFYLYEAIEHPAGECPELDTMVTVHVQARLDKAHDFRSSLTPSVFLRASIAYLTPQWWRFVVIRLRGLQLLAHMVEQSDVTSRRRPESLQLCAVSVHMLNGLFELKQISEHDEQLLSASGRRRFKSHYAQDAALRSSSLGTADGLYFVSSIDISLEVEHRVVGLTIGAVEALGPNLMSHIYHVRSPEDKKSLEKFVLRAVLGL